MEAPIINIINVSHRIDKRDHAISEMFKQGIRLYQFWNAITGNPTFTSISKSHKMIVRDAKMKGLKQVCIGEDDLCFSDVFAWKYYLENMPKDFSLYLSSIYFGQINEYNIVEDFCGFTLYTIHESYYDTFLDTNEMGHIDRSQCERRERLNDSPIIIPKGKFAVCPLFTTYQKEGFSDNVMGEVSYNEKYLGHRKFYCSNKPFQTWDEIHARSAADNNARMAISL